MIKISGRSLLIVISLMILIFRVGEVQAFPDHQVRIIVPTAPGGPNDYVARLIGQKLGEVWGNPVIVENRAGAGGNIATSFVAKSKADGYTILINTSTVAANMALYVNPGYDLEKDFIGISNIGFVPNILVTSPDSNIKSLKDLVSHKVKKINYGSPGTGSTAHLSIAYYLKMIHEEDTEHVGYKGAAPAVMALVSKEVNLASMMMPPTVAFIKNGKLIPLAITGSKRSSVLPNVPTFAELGFEDMDFYTWIAFFVPKQTPDEIVQKIREDVDKVLQKEDVIESLKNAGFEVENTSMLEFAQTIKKEIKYWQKVIAATGIKKL